MKLTNAERKCLILYHLGGVAALRSPEHSVKCATINSLFRKGLTDRNGFTDQGKQLAKQLADEAHQAVVCR